VAVVSRRGAKHVRTLKIAGSRGRAGWEYDAEADVLYLSFGEPEEAEGIDVGEGMIVRMNPQTNEVVGITIIGFSRKILQTR
jgi:uncharacterized protein YuzE